MINKSNKNAKIKPIEPLYIKFLLNPQNHNNAKIKLKIIKQW